MGLKSYNEADLQFFYGRDRVIESLGKITETASLIVVSGASGTGKSSVIKAGLLPLLRKKGWKILPVIRPGEQPMESLAAEIPDLSAELSGEHPTALIIDQFEELITQCLDPQDRVAFESQLATWLTKYDQLRIVISIRSDFEPQFERATLVDWWQKGRYIVPGFSQDELREVIIKPTIQEVLFFEPDTLVDKLVDDVNQAPGALPLLSFTLSELYHAYINSGRTNRAFTLEDYEKLGGVIGALRNRANAIYDGLSEKLQDSMRKLMMRMVSMEGGELASRRVLSEDLTFSDESETERIQTVAHLLVDARLISTGRDSQGRTYYEPAHDALVRAWARLWEWVKALGEGKLSLLYKLSLAVSDYQVYIHTPKARKYLWIKDPKLDLLYNDLVEPEHYFNSQEEVFLRESMNLDRRNTRTRRLWVGATIAVLLGFSVVSFGLWQQSKKNLAELETATEINLRTVLSVAQNNIYNLRYEEALSKYHNAYNSKNHSMEIAKGMMELAFYFGEFASSRALAIADSAVQLLENPEPAKKVLRANQQAGIDSLVHLHQVLKLIDSSWYETLIHRYYPKMVLVEGGRFLMGSEKGEPNERPIHEVELSDYSIATTEVTNWQYNLYFKSTNKDVNETKISLEGKNGDHPVVNVSWYDAAEFANWWSEKEEKELVYAFSGHRQLDSIRHNASGYRLPTEAEWEYAARGGIHQDDFEYSGGEDLNLVGWFDENSHYHSHKVADKLPNSLEVYDMSGNVWEWCQDWYTSDYPSNLVVNPTGPKEKQAYRIFRGGGWFDEASSSRVALRLFDRDPFQRVNDLGFRIIMTP